MRVYQHIHYPALAIVHEKVNADRPKIEIYYQQVNFRSRLKVKYDLKTLLGCQSVQHLCFSMDTVHVIGQQERNSNLGIKDIYFLENQDGEIVYSGSMTLERVERLIKSRDS